jgi:hypothetical protein
LPRRCVLWPLLIFQSESIQSVISFNIDSLSFSEAEYELLLS